MGQHTHTTAEQKTHRNRPKDHLMWSEGKETGWTDIITANYNN